MERTPFGQKKLVTRWGHAHGERRPLSSREHSPRPSKKTVLEWSSRGLSVEVFRPLKALKTRSTAHRRLMAGKRLDAMPPPDLFFAAVQVPGVSFMVEE
jgi:hypothetical protein